MILLTPGTPMNKELVLMQSALMIRCQKLIFYCDKIAYKYFSLLKCKPIDYSFSKSSMPTQKSSELVLKMS